MSVSWPWARRALAAAVLVAVLLTFAPFALASGGGASVTPADARSEAARLMSKVGGETRSNPRSGSAEPSWAGARPGEPLLLRSFDGRPTSYLVPVIDSVERSVSTIGVSASTGRWSWYTSTSQPEFPLVDVEEAAGKVKAFLLERGITVSLPAPQARMAPDKNVYWFFELGRALPVKEIYLPVFMAGRPSSDLEQKPWERVREPVRSPLESRNAGAGAGAGAAPALYPGGAPAAYDIPDVPYHVQQNSYWCGPASLEMLFDYWGDDISQAEIAAVVNASPGDGCYNADLLRAGQFSSMSTAYANPYLRGYVERSIGYGAADTYWENGSTLFSSRYSDLKELVSQNYPVVILTYYNSPPSSGHFRVVKGYNDNIGSFIVHDPWYTAPFQGPDVNFNQSFLVDTLWPYSNRWGMIAAPWDVSVAKPPSVAKGQAFTVEANVSYRGPRPLDGQYPCMANSPTATFQSTGGYQLTGGAVNQQIPGIGATGSSGQVSWTVKALESRSTEDIQVVAQGQVDGSSHTYSSYSDWIGGVGTGTGAPPVTSRKWGHDSVGVPAVATTWYLAEGCTNGGFETWVLVQNPNGSPASVRLTYMTPRGPVDGPSVTLDANSRRSFNVADTVPGSWEVSTRVTSDIGVIAERAMYGPGRQWGHDSVGASSPSKTWYLAEGCTRGGFETWVLVQNPNDAPADVSLTYMTPSGQVKGPTVNLPANSRKTLFVSDTVRDQWSVSTKVTSTRPVIAERAMYGGGRAWGHDSVGVTTPASRWYLAEGCTKGGFETWVLVQNPNDAPADVSLTYMTTEGPVAGPSVTLAPNSRQTFDVADRVPDTWEVSTRVTSNIGVIAERAMYGGSRTWGHDSVGVSSPAADWYLAEGCTQTGFETWLLVQNPNNYEVDVELTYMTPTGPVDGPVATLPANSRTTFNVAETVPLEWDVSTYVHATGGKVIAERAMYGD